MLTVIIAAIVTAIVILLAVMAWQPAPTPADVGEPAHQQADSSDSYTITTSVNQEFEAFGMVWRVDEDGDLMVILENGRSYVIDYVMEPTWTTWQDYDTIDDFTVTITREHVALAEEMRAEVIGDD